MIPSKVEKSSRRSSILKLPKARQPFQSVEANGSPAEDTPMKQKRRVSFAEKKHVKEFCDSMEQGTVWDNTYEESELSHTKNTLPLHNTLSDDNSRIQVLSELSNALNYQSSSQETNLVLHHHQSRKVLIRQNAIDLDYLPIEAIRSRLEPGDINQVIMSANPELLANKENIPAVLKLSVVESSLIEDDDLIIGQKNQQKSNTQGFSVYCDDNIEDENEENLLNRTNHQDISMDCTLPATDSILSYIDNTNNQKLEVNNLVETTERTQVFHEDNAMEMTEAVGSILPSRLKEIQNSNSIFNNKSMNKTQAFDGKSMEMIEIIPPMHPRTFSEDRTQVFDDRHMEMTEAMPSIRPEQFAGNRTRIFQNNSMEMTEVVPVLHILNQPEKPCEDETEVFNNKSMEMTEAISSMRPVQFSGNKTQVFHNNSMEMTETVPVVPISNRPGPFLQDQTEVFNNKSMEMTEAISSMRPVQFSGNKTQVFHNNSMEMTEAVPVVPISNRLGPFLQDKTEVFNNKSMEMTEAISSMRPVQFSGNKTQVFHNNSMEMTEVVPVLPISNRLGPSLQDKTEVFNNKSMEMTEVVSSIRPGQFSGDKTQVFHNNSMEMTEAVSMVPYSRHLARIPDDETRLFHNKSMEMTEAINHHQFSSTSVPQANLQILKSNLNTSNRTQIFTNYCMEHTEVIPSLKRQYQQITDENQKSDCEFTSPNAKSVRNNSVRHERQGSEADLAALHRLLHKNLDESPEKSIIPSSIPLNCHNQSMEMTVAVPAHYIQPTNSNQQSIPAQNVSMEITEVIPSFSNIKDRTIDIQTTSSIVREPEKLPGDCTPDSTSRIKTPPALEVTTHDGLDNSIEQFRSRATSASKLLNNDITYEFTAPIRTTQNVNIDVTNDLEDVEAPSFVYADISDEIPVFGMEREIEEEEAIPMPEISITENTNQLDNPSRTYVMSRDAYEKRDLCEQIDESISDTINENFTKSPIKNIDNVPINRMKNIAVCSQIDSKRNGTVHGDINRVGCRRRTYVVGKDEESAMLRKNKIIRSDTYVINLAVDEVQAEKSINETDTNQSINYQPGSSLAAVRRFGQSNTIERTNISPVRKINLEFEALAENDLIVARIEKQQRIIAATASEKNNVKAGENQLELESSVVSMNSMTEENKSRYDILVDRLNEIANKRNCIWKINSTSPNIISIEYCMTALLLGIVFNVPDHPNELEIIDRVRIVPRISDKEKAILRMTDRLIVQKINVESLKNSYKTYDDVLNLIEYVTNEVNSIFDFYHELKRLSRINSMVVNVDKISFRVWTKQMNIILNISMNIKPFVDIQPEDIDVKCLLGSIRTNDVKNLIRNVKRNHKFLALYINDIKDYIELMEESTATRK